MEEEPMTKEEVEIWERKQQDKVVMCLTLIVVIVSVILLTV